MRRMKLFITSALLLTAALQGARAQYAAQVTLESDASWVVKELIVKQDLLWLENGQVKMPVADVTMVEFRFKKFDLETCEQMFREGEFEKLDEQIEKMLAPVMEFNYFPSNLDDYLVWQLKARFWAGKLTEAQKTAELIRQGSSDAWHVNVAGIYRVTALLDAGKNAEAAAEFEALENPDEIIPALSLYIRARLAEQKQEYRQALLHISKLAAFHGRDAEWLPPATVLEGKIYKKTKRTEAAKNVAEELIIGYPGTQWSKAGEELKTGI